MRGHRFGQLHPYQREVGAEITRSPLRMLDMGSKIVAVARTMTKARLCLLTGRSLASVPEHESRFLSGVRLFSPESN